MRRAVILRSKDRCENPGCTGDIEDVTDRGEPLLEVDHIQDIAKGGPDSPIQMIALCLNCHTIKTHGRSCEQLRQKLLAVAERLHQELLPPGSYLTASHVTGERNPSGAAGALRVSQENREPRMVAWGRRNGPFGSSLNVTGGR